jgi:DNA polymerase I-like protein with 3'-5' exonuclease and polymerase domains
MKPLVVDIEGSREGHVFNYDHKMYILGLYNGEEKWVLPIEWDAGIPYGPALKKAQEVIDQHDLLVAFNLKHDIQWCKRYGLNLQCKSLWCLQYAEYCMSGQRWRMPDLDTACINRGLLGKSHHIKDNYWDKKREINEAPWEEAEAYNSNDLSIEWNLFQKQLEVLKASPKLKKLIWEGSQDLGITSEMEWNGLNYDHALSLREGAKRLDEIHALEAKLYALVPHPQINWGSGQHLSAVLYGGKIKYDDREPYLFTYANPKRAPVTKYRKVERVLEFPQLVKPFPNTELATKGYFSTDEGILRRLKTSGLSKEIISIHLEVAGLNKLVGTYYHGLPKLAQKMGWKDGIIHGQLHHTVTRTGRLSSSKPNQQNLEYGVRQCLVSRFPLSSPQK